MGRLEKALERLKTQDGTAARRAAAPRSASSAVAFDMLSAKAREMTLDREHLRSHRILTEDSDPTVHTAYKMLRTRVIQRMRANRWQSLAVTSAAPGDGKSLTAINLALSIASDVNHTVVLVDLDMRHSTVSRYLGLPVDVGISDVLGRDYPLEEALIRTDMERLLILPNVHVETDSSELISSPEMEALTRRLVRDDPARIVIYDLPPVLSADDMLAFNPYVDAMLFVVSERLTSRSDVLRARELLDECNVLGTVLNRSDEKTASYY
jgi:capsular exopolysaccharide synthesis family protein